MMRKNQEPWRARFVAIILFAVAAVGLAAQPAKAGPVARGAGWGAVSGAVIGGVAGGSPLAGAAVGAATGAIVGSVRKNRRK
jgi:uncharacterized membrane protein